MQFVLPSGAHVRCRSNRALVLIMENQVEACIVQRSDKWEPLRATLDRKRRHRQPSVRYFLGVMRTGDVKPV